MLSCTNDWHINIERGKFTGNIFIDLKKAFDTVDHAILIRKLSKYGIQGLELQWFKSYLSSRQQFTKVNGVESDIGSINCGVPQGSCLGPLLFLIYINDLPFALKNCKVTMYADETRISFSPKSIEDLTETLNNELKCLKEWLQGNKWSLNVIKTQAMVIGSRPNLKKIGENTVDSPVFVIDDTDLILPFMKTSNGQKAFAFRGAKILNDLSREAKQAPSLSSFENKIKGLL